MKLIVSSICGAAMMFTTLGVTTTEAAPVYALPTISTQTDVTPAQYNRRHIRSFERRGRSAYYNGHRGERRAHRGWRRHNGWWFPPAAFITGAIVGGAIANQRRTGNAHVQWCYDRYRSYRASDNTSQPYEGPRRQCYSPYN